MIGLVLVSHSAKLAQGTRELAAQMGGEQLRIGAAGGLDQPGEPLGTDAALVARVIEEVWSDDGVLVLMDLGSAVLSAELALELLPEDRSGRVLLTSAPFVEGAVAAAVAAAAGEPLERVAEEARGGLTGKAAQLGDGDDGTGAWSAAAAPAVAGGGSTAAAPAVAGGGAAAAAPAAVGEEPAAGPPPAHSPVRRSLRLTVDLPFGLHARPAAALVRTVSAFDAAVTVTDATSGRGPASARSLNAVATLGVLCGHEIVVEASGPQTDEALAAVGRLAAGRFGEDAGAAAMEQQAEAPAAEGLPAAAPPLPAPPHPGAVLHGAPASPGIAVGPARRLRAAPVVVPDTPAGAPEAELAALEAALADAAADVRRSKAAVSGRASAAEAAIFDAHLLFLDDEELTEPARRRIRQGDAGAAAAWSAAVAEAAVRWDALDDPYQRARAADLRSVGDLVLRHLLGLPATFAPTGAGIVLAPDLTPAEAAALDPATVCGVACAGGGPTSHGAILARSLGLPAVMAIGDALLDIEEGVLLVLDGQEGTVTVDPPPAVQQAAEERRRVREQDEAHARAQARSPARTTDGVDVRVSANIAAPDEVTAALAQGADGVGLLRTEFLFLGADRLPTEDEQERAYRQVAATMGGRPLTLRTLDAGADKPLPALSPAAEANPFLGVRGLRLSLRHPDVFAVQLRAALRVAADHPLHLMFPMVATLDELEAALEALAEARAQLTAARVPADRYLRVGIMVEVPSAALTAEALAPHVDFFSIGTNDLTQYVLAADRGNAELRGLTDALHPAVLGLIDRTVRAAGAAGKWVAVCGELAGDPAAVPLLIGLGVRELSMAPSRIPAAKRAVRGTSHAAASGLAREALLLRTAEEVRRLTGRHGGS